MRSIYGVMTPLWLCGWYRANLTLIQVPLSNPSVNLSMSWIDIPNPSIRNQYDNVISTHINSDNFTIKVLIRFCTGKE